MALGQGSLERVSKASCLLFRDVLACRRMARHRRLFISASPSFRPPPPRQPTFATPFEKAEHDIRALVDVILHPLILDANHNAVKKAIEKDVKDNYDFLVDPNFYTRIDGVSQPEHPGRSKLLLGPMYRHPNSYIKKSK